MIAENLPLSEVWRAIDIYLANAYSSTPPSSVRVKLDVLRNLQPVEFFANPQFEKDDAADVTKLSLRLGNKLYPHMKLTIERAPDHKTYLFRADTHDSHCCPARGARDHDAFTQLMAENQKVAQAIETAWADQHVPTFKTFLREDLARRARGEST